MALLMLQNLVFACLLLLQGSAVFSISPSSSSLVPEFSPNGFRTTLPPLNPAPGPTINEDATTPLPPNAPMYNFVLPPVTSSTIGPALPPNESHKRPQHPNLPVMGPEAQGEYHVPPSSTPLPGNNSKRVAAPINKHSHLNPSPTNGHVAPSPYSKSAPNTWLHSPAYVPSPTIQNYHLKKNNISAPSPLPIAVSPRASSKQDHQNPNLKTNFNHHTFPPLNSEGHNSPAPSPTLPKQNKIPQSLPHYPRKPLPALPSPPPNADCASLTCAEPLTSSITGPFCICILPIQIGLLLNVPVYTFFPLVSELASEISQGIFMKQIQVRIIGANEATQDPEMTAVLIDLVPLENKFDHKTAYLTFQRFWNKKVNIKTSLFGNYEVLYVRYPGLPSSPPSSYSNGGTIYSDPYNNHNNDARSIKPLGVDVSKIRHKKAFKLNTSLIIIIILSALVAIILCCAITWVLFLKNKHRVSQTTPSFTKSSGASGISSTSNGSNIVNYTGSAKTFSINEIEKATNKFNETKIIGEGGFGRVYSGVLNNGIKVAVKVLKRDDNQGVKEFLSEVEMLNRLHHRNLVKLIGICIENRTRCLIYELVPNGSVESHLHGIDKERAPLNWSTRLKIALGSARGLAYLHEDSNPRVIHRDFKSSNILLEDDFMPKVSDFGLARIGLDEENKHISTRVMGTFGYVAPEYAMTGHLLVKSDVYSYGVVLLELLTGRKPVDMSQPPGQENLVTWARPLLINEEGLLLMVDKSLNGNFPKESLAKVAAIALMCVEPEVSNRPFMGEVVQALKLVCNEIEEREEDFNGFNESPMSFYDCGIDLERQVSMSELLNSSVQYERPEYDTHRRCSSSGPLRSKNTKMLWQKVRRLSRGSVSEHGVMFNLWPRSY